MAAANTDVDKVYHLAITLFPDLNIRLSDLQHPTESFLTKTFVNFLKAFGFRIEPPFNLDNESKDPSREKRVFLAKLCRQVEKILQYSFPNKSYTYADIIEPSAKKTKNTLDFLFNYWAYYKLYKKDVLAPVEEKFKQRESLIAEIEQKRLILEQRKGQAISMITDIEKAHQDIAKLRNELPKAEEELLRQKTLSKEQKEGLHHQEKRHEDLLAQVKHWKQKVVNDAQVEELLKEIETTERSIETYQKEFTIQKQVFQTQREEIDSNKEMVKNLDELIEILPPGLVEERVSLLEHIISLKKELSALESEKQKSAGILSTNQQQLQQSMEEYKRCKDLHEKHEKERLKHIDSIKNEIESQKESANQLEDDLADLQVKIEREESTGDFIQDNVKHILGQYWQSK